MTKLAQEQGASELNDLLYAVTVEAKKIYGEPQYKYYKLTARWSQPRTRTGRKSGDGYHVTERPRPENEISEQEYFDNVGHSRKQVISAFYGDLKHSYLKYERKLVKDGWREHLIKLIEDI